MHPQFLPQGPAPPTPLSIKAPQCRVLFPAWSLADTCLNGTFQRTQHYFGFSRSLRLSGASVTSSNGAAHETPPWTQTVTCAQLLKVGSPAACPSLADFKTVTLSSGLADAVAVCRCDWPGRQHRVSRTRRAGERVPPLSRNTSSPRHPSPDTTSSQSRGSQPRPPASWAGSSHP